METHTFVDYTHINKIFLGEVWTELLNIIYGQFFPQTRDWQWLLHVAVTKVSLSLPPEVSGGRLLALLLSASVRVRPSASVRVRPYYINRLITWTLLKLLLWKLNMFSLRKKVPLKNFCLYFGLLLTNLWPLGTNTLWPLFREKFLTDCHQSSYLALVYYSPDLIRFWCTLAYFWRSYDVFFINNITNLCLAVSWEQFMTFHHQTWHFVSIYYPTKLIW